MYHNSNKKNKISVGIIKIYLIATLILFLCISFLTSCTNNRSVKQDVKSVPEQIDIQLLATSDTHGKFYPWNYVTNMEDKSGSFAQIATIVKEKRTDNTILLDGGDMCQDNAVDFFKNDDLNPMVLSLNTIGYDVWTTGNHEYNFGMDFIKKIISTLKAKVIQGNVFDKSGNGIADPYTIIVKNGVRIGVVSAITPKIKVWDSGNLKDYTVEEPVACIKKQISEIKDKTDIIIALVHMGLENEPGVTNASVTDIANACPELEVIIASHDHSPLFDCIINNALVVENHNQAKSLAEIHLVVEKIDTGYKIVNKTSSLINVKDYEADEEFMKILEPYHKRAVNNSNTVIGNVTLEKKSKTENIKGIPNALLQDDDVVQLINQVQMYYAKAKVSATAIFNKNTSINNGPFKRCDVANVYRYANTLCKVEITGKQLKKYMEYCAKFYKQYKPGDLTIAFSDTMRYINYDMFDGVKYEIDISKPEGERIKNLRWMDDTPVKDDEVFEMAVSNYRVDAELSPRNGIFDEKDSPKVIERNIKNDIGSMQDLIVDYIVNVCHGNLKILTDDNWKIIGNDWDKELHKKAVEQINEGIIEIDAGKEERIFNTKAITEDDLK